MDSGELGHWDGDVFRFVPPRVWVYDGGVVPVRTLNLGHLGVELSDVDKAEAVADLVARTEPGAGRV